MKIFRILTLVAPTMLVVLYSLAVAFIQSISNTTYNASMVIVVVLVGNIIIGLYLAYYSLFNELKQAKSRAQIPQFLSLLIIPAMIITYPIVWQTAISTKIFHAITSHGLGQYSVILAHHIGIMIMMSSRTETRAKDAE